MNKDFWELRARKYKTTGYIDYSIAFFDQLMRLKVIENLIRQYANFDIKLANMLDFGCGNGDFIVYFSAKVKNAVGYDISNEILKVAQERCRDLSNVRFENDLGKIKEKFDIVLSVTVLQHILDNDELKKNLYKIGNLCNKGALFIALESVKSANCINIGISDYFVLRETEYYKNILEEAGFRVLTIENFYNPYFLKTPSYERYLRKIYIYRLFYKVLTKFGVNPTIFNSKFNSCASEILGIPENIDGIVEKESSTKIFVAKKI